MQLACNLKVLLFGEVKIKENLLKHAV